MSTPRSIRLTRRRASRALDGQGSTGTPDLDQVLSAVTAPATASELSHEAAVIAMFQGARQGSVAKAGRPSMLKSTLAKLAAAKLVAAAAAAAILASGGLALAASTGHLPSPLSHSDRATTGDAHATAAPGKPSSVATHPTEDATDTTDTTDPTDPTDPASPSPTPSLKGLCTAYQAGSTANAGKALASPAFQALVTAAGGTDQVAGYCTALIGTRAPHPTGARTSHPTGASMSHPAGAPAGVPAPHRGAPATHPGVPATHPGAPGH